MPQAYGLHLPFAQHRNAAAYAKWPGLDSAAAGIPGRGTPSKTYDNGQMQARS